jgi:hypothetical protein
MALCDNCGKSVGYSDKVFYGSGAYCEECHPDPEGKYCPECGCSHAEHATMHRLLYELHAWGQLQGTWEAQCWIDLAELIGEWAGGKMKSESDGGPWEQ